MIPGTIKRVANKGHVFGWKLPEDVYLQHSPDAVFHWNPGDIVIILEMDKQRVNRFPFVLEAAKLLLPDGSVFWTSVGRISSGFEEME